MSNKVRVIREDNSVSEKLIASNYDLGTVAECLGQNSGAVTGYWMTVGIGGDVRWADLQTGWRFKSASPTSWINGRILPKGTKIEIEIG